MKNINVEDRVYSLEDEEVLDKIKQSKEIIFSYPVQYSSPPKYVRDFIENNAMIWRDKHIFVIATFGLFSGDGSGVLARLLQRYGANITGGLHLIMPDSIADEPVLKRSFEKNKTLVKKAKLKIEKALNAYLQNKPTQEGLQVISRCLGAISQRFVFGYKTKRYHKTVTIHKDMCVFCKKCIALCPMHNITIRDNQVITKDKCTLCYRCVNSCPTKAITILGKKVIQQNHLDMYVAPNKKQ